MSMKAKVHVSNSMCWTILAQNYAKRVGFRRGTFVSSGRGPLGFERGTFT